MTHGDVDAMEVEVVLRSNNQPCPCDNTDMDVGMPGIDLPALPQLPSHFPKNHEGNVGIPRMPLLVACTNQGSDLSPAVAWGDYKLPEEPILSADAVVVVANRKDSQGKLTRLNNKESL